MAKRINVIYKVDNKELQQTKTVLKDVEAETKKSEAQMTKLSKSAKEAGQTSSKSFLDFKNIIATISFAGIIAGVTALGKKIFELGVQQEQLNIAFTTFLGSAEKAKRMIADLTKFAIVTPFTPEQVNKAARTLLAFGTAAKDIIPTLKMIGDVSAGTGKDLAEMAVIFGQIQSTGRLMGQDLLQLINAGFNPLQQISQKTGRSVKDLKEDMEKGLITFDMVKQSFVDATSAGGLFFNLMEKQSVSVGGKLSTVAGNIDEIGKNLFSTASGPLSKAVDILVLISEKLLKMSVPLEEKFKQTLIEFGESSDEFKEASKNVLFEFGPEKVNELLKIARAEKVLAFSFIEDQEKANRLLVEFIRLKELQLKSGPTVEDAVLSARRDQLRLEIDMAKRRLADIQSQAGPTKPGFKVTPSVEGMGPGGKEITDMINGLVFPEEDAEKFKDKLDKLSDGILKEFQADIKSEQDIRNEANEEELEAWAEKERKKREISQQTFDIGVDLLGALLLSQTDNSNQEMALLEDKYDREIELAGDNEQAKKSIEQKRRVEIQALQKKQAQEDKQRRINTIIGESLINAVKALGLPPIPGANFIAAAQAIAYGAVTAAIAGKYKEGGWINGPGTGTSDSVPILASNGEFMVRASAAAQSPNLLEAINERRLSDNVLRSMSTNGGSVASVQDNEAVVRAIKDSRVDYDLHGFTLMKAQRQGDNFKRYIRSKVQGYK